MSFAFDKEQLSSTFGKYQKASYRFQNFFDQGVSGKVELISPEVWETQHGIRRFKLAAGEEGKQVFEVLLRPDANSGPQPVRIDFDIAADRQYQFSVYRTMQIGLGDIMIEASTQLGENGELMVEQHLINETDQAPSFNCLLFAPDRRRQRIQVFNAGRGRTTSHFVLPDGAGLVGKTIWLRAEEIGGARILNHRVTVTP
jgi:hypothetical protein